MDRFEGQFKLNMDGLLEVLAGSLYANPSVGLRELIQNAHDSCTRFSIEAGDEGYEPRIGVLLTGRKLIITDNGSGLTRDEIETYLTTIGKSYTGELRSQLNLFEAESSQQLIGQFGFGFLSAFMLADEVIVETKSWQPDHEALRLTASGGDSFSLENCPHPIAQGTTIQLSVRPDAEFLLEPTILSQKIRQFANFLPIPIYLNEGDQPENVMLPPWQQPNVAEAIGAFIEREFQMDSALAIVVLHDHVEEVGDGDVVEIPLSGFLFIPPVSVASVREFGDLHIYIRSMFITNNEEGLLPPWAKFVRGLVESPYLHPTASRETIRRDENFYAIRKALGQQLAAALREIQSQDPVRWNQIVRGHADIMTSWAVRDDEFFSQVADILTFRTSQGQMTLADYLKLTDGKFYYVTREIKSLQEKVLAEGNSYPVIEAVWFAVRPFLEKYADAHGQLELVPLDEEPTKLFEEADKAQFVDLLAVSERLNIPVRVAAFEPSQIPALLIQPKDAQRWDEAKDALANDEFDPAIADLLSAFIEKAPEDSAQETLFFNARCPFIIELSNNTLPEKQQQMIVELLYQIARLFSGKSMNATAAIDAFQSLTIALGEIAK